MISPVIVRDIFYEGKFYAFIPADDAGKYWWRQSFTRIANAAGYKANVYPIGEAFYGIVRPAKWQDYSRKNAGDLADISSNGWSIKFHNTEAKYAEWKIPDGHNRIHCICRTKAAATAYGVWNLSLGSTSGAIDLNGELDFTTLDLGDGSVSDGINEFVLTVTANSAGEKYLRFTVPAGGETCTIVGVHSFDDDGIGDPSTVNGVDSLGEGHDLVDKLTYAAAWVAFHGVLGSTDTYKLLKANSCELTIRWKKSGEGGDGKWTSYGPAHYGGGNADFIATTKTVLYVGGSLIGDMEDVGTIPRGTLYENDRLYTFVKGFGDYDEDGGAAPDALDILVAAIGTSITPNGIGVNVDVEWTADGVLTNCYSPTIPLVDDTIGFVVFPPDATKYPYAGGASPTYSVNGVIAANIHLDVASVVLENKSNGPNEKIFKQESDSNCKLYHYIDEALLPGGSTPPSGTHWLFGCFMSVRRERVIGHSLVG